MSFISVDTLAGDIAQNTSTSINVKADLTAMNSDYVDAALIKWFYSDSVDTDGNLVNPQHNNQFDRGLGTLGQVSSNITGLTSETEYHYKAKAQSVTYRSDESLENALNSVGFYKFGVEVEEVMDKIINNETYMNNILNNLNKLTYLTKSDFGMSKIANEYWTSTTLSKWLKSPYIIETFWSEPTSSYFVDRGSTVEGTSPGEWWTYLDLTGVNTLELYSRLTFYYTSAIMIGGSSVASDYPTHDYTKRTFDVSGRSGSTQLKIEYGSIGDYYVEPGAGYSGGKSAKIYRGDITSRRFEISDIKLI